MVRLVDNPEVALAIGYAPPRLGESMRALLALDDALGAVLRGTTQPMLAQIRLAWWRERLEALDSEAPPAMPVLVDVQRSCVANGVSGAALAGMAMGWERLATAESLDLAVLDQCAAERGGTLFRAIAALAAVPPPPGLDAAGQGWAMADLSRHLSDMAMASDAQRRAAAMLAEGPGRWPVPLRMLGALALLARMDCAMPPDQPIPHGSPRRVARMLAMRLTGR
ncbi:squalene/phytoene synthase family protein [Sphingomonas sp. CJ99]